MQPLPICCLLAHLPFQSPPVTDSYWPVPHTLELLSAERKWSRCQYFWVPRKTLCQLYGAQRKFLIGKKRECSLCNKVLCQFNSINTEHQLTTEEGKNQTVAGHLVSEQLHVSKELEFCNVREQQQKSTIPIKCFM